MCCLKGLEPLLECQESRYSASDREPGTEELGSIMGKQLYLAVENMYALLSHGLDSSHRGRRDTPITLFISHSPNNCLIIPGIGHSWSITSETIMTPE